MTPALAVVVKNSNNATANLPEHDRIDIEIEIEIESEIEIEIEIEMLQK